ncbi:MAG: NAD(P)-dependent oxidoreductase [Rhodospirillales bacterium]
MAADMAAGQGDSLNGMTIGFIGLGLMGRPMALNLHNAGARLVIHNRSQGVVSELAGQGMSGAATPAAVAAQADTIIMMLPDTPAVRTVLLGDDGLIGGVGANHLIIDMGTTAVTDTRELAGKIEARGGDYLDAPVSGGTIGAEGGTLNIMAGGAEAAVERAMPLFEVLGKSVVHVGGSGTGQVAKAANQVIVGLTIGAVAEALELAKRSGADPARVRQALKGGFADSRILEVHGQRMVDGDFRPGGKCATQRKDMAQAIELAAESGLELPATALNKELYERIIEAGFGDLDHSALIKVFDLD